MRSFRAAKRIRVVHPGGGDSMTEQSHEKECNINNIMAKYVKTGLINHVQKYEGTYGDVTGADFKAAQDLIAEQKSVFHELPAEVRAEFGNDPAEYLDLMATDEGLETLQSILNPVVKDENDPSEPDSEGQIQTKTETDQSESAVT